MNKKPLIVSSLAISLFVPSILMAKPPHEKHKHHKQHHNHQAHKKTHKTKGPNIRFKGMDKNGDGKITRDEWRGNNNSFNQHDWNGNGVLSGDEVKPGAKRYAESKLSSDPDLKKRLDEQFGGIDLNRDGRITWEEWKLDRNLFDRLDTNNSGWISLREFYLMEHEGGIVTNLVGRVKRVWSDFVSTIF